MPRNLKVFAGFSSCDIAGRSNLYAIVAAPTPERAAELIRCSMHHFRNYWSETGSGQAIKAALARPETALYEAGREGSGKFMTEEEAQNAVQMRK